MKIEVNKKYFIIIMTTLLVIVGAFFVMSYANPSTGVGHSADEIGLTGFCVFSYEVGGCPAGWSRMEEFENRAIRSMNMSDSSQDLALDGGIGGFDEIPIACGGECAGHVNTGTPYTAYLLDNWPPYANVLVCCKD